MLQVVPLKMVDNGLNYLFGVHPVSTYCHISNTRRLTPLLRKSRKVIGDSFSEEAYFLLYKALSARSKGKRGISSRVLNAQVHINSEAVLRCERSAVHS